MLRDLFKYGANPTYRALFQGTDYQGRIVAWFRLAGEGAGSGRERAERREDRRGMRRPHDVRSADLDGPVERSARAEGSSLPPTSTFTRRERSTQ
jgi:hypothetical protein